MKITKILRNPKKKMCKRWKFKKMKKKNSFS